MRRVPELARAVARAAALGALVAGVARAQGIGEGFRDEQAGRLAAAADAYRVTLSGNPTDLAALFGLERVLPRLGRLPELLPLVQAAVARTGGTPGPYLALELRTFAALNLPDSVAALVRRWTAAAPRDPTPWREWAVALADRGDVDAARAALLHGRRVLGDSNALAPDLAAFAERAGDWAAAADEWRRAVSADPGMLENAFAQLSLLPPGARDTAARALARDAGPPAARRLGAFVLLGQGDAAAAWRLMLASVTPPGPDAGEALWRFAELAGERADSAARDVRGLALARFAELAPPGPLAVQSRMDAAREFLAARDLPRAQAMLARLVADSASPEAQALARTVFVEAALAAGDLDSAARALASAAGRIPGGVADSLRRDLAWRRLMRGELDAADSGLAGDSSVEASAIRGWAELYRGRLQRALTLFRDAGPYAGPRERAVRRGEMVALVTAAAGVSSPALGAALLALDQGDTTAVAALARAAPEFRPAGRAAVLLIAGRAAARLGPAWTSRAESLFAAAAADTAGYAPPAAELEWARLLAARGRTADAVAHLERVILEFPKSAVAPQARRELDRLQGAVPGT